MKLAVVNLTGGGFSGGYRKYLRRMVPLLSQHPRVERLDVFVPPQSMRNVADFAIPLRTWPADDARSGFAQLKRDLHALRPDVVFIPTARHIDLGAIAVVAMVRNMEPLLVPFGGNPLTEALRNLARAAAARRAVRRARRVIAVSGFVRDFLVERWRIDPRRVGVVPHGVDPLAAQPNRDEKDSGPLFTAGSIRPARGLEDAIRALAILKKRRTVKLVIAGAPDGPMLRYAARLRRLAASLGVDRDVDWAGQLAENAMTDAMRGCAAFVMTSRAEACPNLALEAMSAGCATVSVDHRPMPEFFGDAALYYRAGQVDQLAQQLLRVLEVPGPAMTALRDAAQSRAAQFTWSRTAEQTIAELERAIA